VIVTRGLTHIALEVANLEVTIAFYSALVGAKVLVKSRDAAEIGTPGAHDVISLQRVEGSRRKPFETHIGFRLVTPVPVEELVKAVEAAGGPVVESGEFGPGMPYVFTKDPDGYAVELWFEPPNAARAEPGLS
jgi:catechol 2,3-dioxygenase-like lactoylglutathione lyase family enzyme